MACFIRQYSGACLQPIPPTGPKEQKDLRRNLSMAKGQFGSCALHGQEMEAEALPAAPFPIAPSCFLGVFWGTLVLDPHQTWTFRGLNPQVLHGVSPFSPSPLLFWNYERPAFLVSSPYKPTQKFPEIEKSSPPAPTPSQDGNRGFLPICHIS